MRLRALTIAMATVLLLGACKGSGDGIACTVDGSLSVTIPEELAITFVPASLSVEKANTAVVSLLENQLRRLRLVYRRHRAN